MRACTLSLAQATSDFHLFGAIMYRVFLSYNTAADEMVIVWRLQTLAAASGLHLDVPNKEQRTDRVIIEKMIGNADSVIALLTKSAARSKRVEEEIRYAISLNKPIIPIIEKGVAAGPIKTLLGKAGTPVFELDPRSPWNMETALSTYLQKEMRDKNARNAIFALAGTFIGLFLLDKLAES